MMNIENKSNSSNFLKYLILIDLIKKASLKLNVNNLNELGTALEEYIDNSEYVLIEDVVDFENHIVEGSIEYLVENYSTNETFSDGDWSISTAFLFDKEWVFLIDNEYYLMIHSDWDNEYIEELRNYIWKKNIAKYRKSISETLGINYIFSNDGDEIIREGFNYDEEFISKPNDKTKEVETIQPTFNESVLDKHYKYNRDNQRYFFDYLNELYTFFKIGETKDCNQKTLGGICAAIYESKVITNCNTFSECMRLLCTYWRRELPKDCRLNKYQESKQELLDKHRILNEIPTK